ncbi:ABC-F family ATP-binding cassette domain-containing protein [Sulfurospirillum sp. 1612]|uniref:ABC-F family ATP-binding cassette domain-containing protein n=1 Tax=Sulfurospirillum sp. 1612 TaxID=3094835 RepID=UPI002F946EBE
MIQLNNISKSFATVELLSHINLKLTPKSRVGLVGRNGSGKSTLFKIILGELEADSGEISIPKNYRIGALKQHLEFTENTILDEVALALGEEVKYDIYRVEKILFGLGFSQEDLTQSPLSFSGGYQIRLNLAKLLVQEPNLLLLDEPTNYLDIVSLRWLERFLQRFDGEVILITHNRDFMDKITTHTMGIVRKNLIMIEGNTQKFYAHIKEQDALYAKQKINQDKKIKELEVFIAKNKTRASTAALAQSKVKQLEKIERLEDLSSEVVLDFDFNYKETPAKIVMEVDNLAFGYKQDNILFQNVSFALKKGTCLGIIGKNGKGKSTLLNTLAGILTPNSGTITFHPSITFAHFGQTNVNRLNLDNTVFEEIYAANPKLSVGEARSICGAMMFSGESADKKISLLSGGEKSRVMLGIALSQEVNLLFLDEPTNHLDMESIASLTQAIENFPGSVVLVTHSEELLRRVADQLIVFGREGAQYFDDGYDAFLEKIGWEEEENEKKETPSQPKTNPYEIKKARTALLQERNKKAAPFKKEIERTEQFIIAAEAKMVAYQKALIEHINKGEHDQISDLSMGLAGLESDIETSYFNLEIAQDNFDRIINEYEQKIAALGE